MKTLMNKNFWAALTIIIFAASCSTQVGVSNHKELMAYETVSAVVVNPITDNTKMSDAIGQSITTTLIDNMAADIRYAGDIPKLQSALIKDNLIADGQVNMQELSRIGSAVNAKEVICVKVNSKSSYPPQSIAALVIVRSADGSQYKQKVGFVNISMKNPLHQREFASFVGGELKSPLKDKFTRKTNINAETAMLSNDEFSRFVGYKIAKHIIYMKKY